MAYIYKITNTINQKVYIGKTNFSIEQRWKEHCRESKRKKNINRPLYQAINKYGISSFTIEEIESCLIEESYDREKFWISYYDSFINGYNATLGGDGKTYLDYNIIVLTYQKTQNINETARILDVNPSSISKILKNYDINICLNPKSSIKVNSKKVKRYSLEGDYIDTFNSLSEAGKELGDVNKKKHISEVCNGKRKTAYGFKWSFV